MADRFINASFGFLGAVLVASWVIKRIAYHSGADEKGLPLDPAAAVEANFIIMVALLGAYLLWSAMILGPPAWRYLRMARRHRCLPRLEGEPRMYRRQSVHRKDTHELAVNHQTILAVASPGGGGSSKGGSRVRAAETAQ